MRSLNKYVENGTRKHFVHTINFSVITVSVVGGDFVFTVYGSKNVKNIAVPHYLRDSDTIFLTLLKCTSNHNIQKLNLII